jgi:uncharacterized phage protein gp47/JayE
LLDDNVYSITSGASATAETILSALAEAITSGEFTAEYTDKTLIISSVDLQERHNMTLSPNLTTQSVTGIVNFSSAENGDIDLPNGTINIIATAIAGFLSVNNLVPRISGRLEETDIELRKSYTNKIFMRSSRMNDSIKAQILLLPGVSYCDVKDNPTNQTDAHGRPPHSVEAVVEGGDDTQIAAAILDTKAAGINTHGSVAVDLILNSSETLTIRFNRPQYVYVWFRVTVTAVGNLPVDYADIIKSVILSRVEALGPTDYVVPQEFIGEMFAKIPNLAHIEIPVFYSTNPAATPTTYSEGAVPLNARQRAATSAASSLSDLRKNKGIEAILI